MEEKLASFSYEVFDIIKNKKITININSIKPLMDHKYDEIINDVVSYLEFLDPIKIYGILIGNLDSIVTIEDAINVLISDFQTKEFKVVCQVPKKINLHYDYFELEENHSPKKRVIIPIIGLSIFVIYLIIKSLI